MEINLSNINEIVQFFLSIYVFSVISVITIWIYLRFIVDFDQCHTS